MNTPLVTIITVCFNSETEIEKTIKSVISQTYKNIEYIIIDGKSTDSTLSIIDKYKDHITIIVSEKDNGVYDAMNKGINLSNGSWINFMNAGDTFYDNYVIEKVFTSTYHSSDIIFGDYYENRKGKLVLGPQHPFIRCQKSFTDVGICHQTVFVPAILAKRLMFNTNYKYCADFYMLRKLWLMGCNFIYNPIPICVYSWGDGLSSNIRNRIKVFRENYEVCDCGWSINYLYEQLKNYVKLIIKHK